MRLVFLGVYFSEVGAGILGPMGRSAAERRFFHFCTMLVPTP